MPISPKEALALTSDDNQIVEDLQNRIDKYVLENFQGDVGGTGGSIEVPIEDLSQVKFKIKREISNNYIQAGWKIAEFDNSKFRLSTYDRGNSYYDR